MTLHIVALFRRLQHKLGRWAHGCFSPVTFRFRAAYQRVAIRPAEIILNGFVIQARPLILFVVAWRGQSRRAQRLSHTGKAAGAGLTADVTLLLGAHDGHQVGSQHATVLLSNLPAQALAEMSVAEPLKLIPTRLASLQVWKHQRGQSEAAGLRCAKAWPSPAGVLTCLTEVARIWWQTETGHLPLVISARGPIETGLISTEIWNYTKVWFIAKYCWEWTQNTVCEVWSLGTKP